MIKCHLSRIMGERRVKIAELARLTGIHRNTLTLLYYEKTQRMELDALDKLCEFFECSVGDILEYSKE